MHAAPHYHKLCSRVSRIWRHRRSQHTHSAMAEPRCGRTTFVITVSPLSGSSVLFSQLSRVRFFAIPGKYEVILPAARTAHCSHRLTLLLPPSLPPPSAPHRFPRLSGTPNNSSNKIQEYLGKTSTTGKVAGPVLYHFRCKIYISPAPFRTCKAVPLLQPTPCPIISPPTPAETTNGQAGC